MMDPIWRETPVRSGAPQRATLNPQEEQYGLRVRNPMWIHKADFEIQFKIKSPYGGISIIFLGGSFFPPKSWWHLKAENLGEQRQDRDYFWRGLLAATDAPSVAIQPFNHSLPSPTMMAMATATAHIH